MTGGCRLHAGGPDHRVHRRHPQSRRRARSRRSRLPKQRPLAARARDGASQTSATPAVAAAAESAQDEGLGMTGWAGGWMGGRRGGEVGWRPFGRVGCDARLAVVVVGLKVQTRQRVARPVPFALWCFAPGPHDDGLSGASCRMLSITLSSAFTLLTCSLARVVAGCS